MERIKALWNEIIDSLWFVPGVLTLAAGALAVALVANNNEIMALLGVEAHEVWWLFGGSASGALSVLESISGSIITVTGVVFSVTIIALQLASSQFTPRVLRQFMADRGNQAVLGVFIGTFTYTLIVQRTVRGEEPNGTFVPAVAVTGAVFLALTSIGFFIFFINHLARSIQAAVVIDSTTHAALRVLRTAFPDTLPAGVDAPIRTAGDVLAELGVAEDRARPVFAPRAGYLQAIDTEALVEAAQRHGLLICMEVEIGTYLLPGLIVMRAWPEREVQQRELEQLCSALVLGLERTPRQDLKHGIIELMDMAVKGLSPSINDPTTAVNAVQRMAQVLLDMAWRVRGDSVHVDEQGSVRLIVRRPRLDDTVDLAFNQVRHFGGSNPTVMITLIESLSTLAALAPAEARAAFTTQLERAIGTATDRIRDDADRERLKNAIARALRTAQAPPLPQRPHH